MLNNKPRNKPLELSNKLKQVLKKYRESLTVTDELLIEDTIRLLDQVKKSNAGGEHMEKESKIVMNILKLFMKSSEMLEIVNSL